MKKQDSKYMYIPTCSGGIRTKVNREDFWDRGRREFYGSEEYFQLFRSLGSKMQSLFYAEDFVGLTKENLEEVSALIGRCIDFQDKQENYYRLFIEDYCCFSLEEFYKGWGKVKREVSPELFELYSEWLAPAVATFGFFDPSKCLDISTPDLSEIKRIVDKCIEAKKKEGCSPTIKK